LYTGALSDGYGVVSHSSTYKVHRISAHVYLGFNLNDETIQVNHKLICPNKNCWNPEHLYVGTQNENNADKQQTKNATVGPWGNAIYESIKTHCPHGHEYTPENTKIQANKGSRQCRECDKIRKRGGRKPRNLIYGKSYSNIKKS